MSCDPAIISGLKLWLKGDDAATGTITTWNDASGQGNNATAVNSPTGVDAVLNGHRIVRFVASEIDHFTFTDFASGFTAGEVFIVIKINNDPPGGDNTVTGLWTLGTDQNTHYPWTDENIYETFGTNSRKTITNPAPSLASWRVYSIRSAANDWEAYLDGTSIHGPVGINTVAFPSAPKLGANSDNGFRLDGDIAEFAFFDRGLDTTERGNMWHYFAEKFALTIANTVACPGLSPSFRINKLRPAFFKPGLAR